MLLLIHFHFHFKCLCLDYVCMWRSVQMFGLLSLGSRAEKGSIQESSVLLPLLLTCSVTDTCVACTEVDAKLQSVRTCTSHYSLMQWQLHGLWKALLKGSNDQLLNQDPFPLSWWWMNQIASQLQATCFNQPANNAECAGPSLGYILSKPVQRFVAVCLSACSFNTRVPRCIIHHSSYKSWQVQWVFDHASPKQCHNAGSIIVHNGANLLGVILKLAATSYKRFCKAGFCVYFL